MPTCEEVSRSLGAAWQLFLGDEEGMRRLDLTLAGFWRSFAAILLAAPLYALFLLAEWRLVEASGDYVEESLDLGRYLAVKIPGLGFDWIAFPLAMVFLARVVGLSHSYVPYIVAYNWSGVIAVAILVPPTVLYAAGLLPEGPAVFLTVLLLALVIHYRYRVARIALGAPAVTAAGLVAFDVLLGLVLGEMINRVAGL